MLYYSNGGPGPATKLLRVDAPPNADASGWRRSKAHIWGVNGWQPWPDAQDQILSSGDYFMVDASQVPEIQQQIKDMYESRH